jgi:pimeloyl-ACP methyl ester carboxylesterase
MRAVAEVQRVESADGTPIAYRAAGSGEPVVFVHGSGTSGADWLFVLRHLRDRFTVVTMDRRGRGASGDGAGGEHSIEHEADDVLAGLDAVGAELLVAHSYGALCSIRAVERGARLGRMVLYEPPIAVRGERVRGLDRLVAEGRLDEALERFLAAAGAPPDQLELIRSSPAWAVLLDAVPALPREMAAAREWQNPAGPIEVATLFLLGAETDGPVYLDGLDELHAAFTDLRLELIPGQRHVAHVFAAEAFASLVGEFLAG